MRVTKHNVLNYGKYAYGIGVCPSGTTTFSAVVLTYTMTVKS